MRRLIRKTICAEQDADALVNRMFHIIHKSHLFLTMPLSFDTTPFC